MYTHFALSTGLALLQSLLLPGPGSTQAPPDRGRVPLPRVARAAPGSSGQVITTYDRLEDRTRVTVVLAPGSRSFGLGSRAELDVSFTYPGRELRAPPESLAFVVESFTPVRGGWAFKRSTVLRGEPGEGRPVEYASADYARQPAWFLGPGRREVLFFQIPAAEVLALTESAKLTLRVGRWQVRLSGERLETLRRLARGLMPADH